MTRVIIPYCLYLLNVHHQWIDCKEIKKNEKKDKSLPDSLWPYLESLENFWSCFLFLLKLSAKRIYSLHTLYKCSNDQRNIWETFTCFNNIAGFERTVITVITWVYNLLHWIWLMAVRIRFNFLHRRWTVHFVLHIFDYWTNSILFLKNVCIKFQKPYNVFSSSWNRKWHASGLMTPLSKYIVFVHFESFYTM